jgi:hypothetical protein
MEIPRFETWGGLNEAFPGQPSKYSKVRPAMQFWVLRE